MKEIQKNKSLLNFFLHSWDRLTPMLVSLIILIVSLIYYYNNGIDGGFIFVVFLMPTVFISVFIDGYKTWKRINK